MAPNKQILAAMAIVDFFRTESGKDMTSIDGPAIYYLVLREYPYDRLCYLLRQKGFSFDEGQLARYVYDNVPDFDLHQDVTGFSRQVPRSLPDSSKAPQERRRVIGEPETRPNPTPGEEYVIDELAELPYDYRRFFGSEATQLLKHIQISADQQIGSLRDGLNVLSFLCDLVDQDLSAEGNFRYDTHGFTVLIPQDKMQLKYHRVAKKSLQKHLVPEVRWLKNKQRKSKVQRRYKEDNHELCWWVAQALHYGVPLKLHVEDIKTDMQKAVVDGTLKVPARLERLRMKLQAEHEGRDFDPEGFSDDEPSVKEDSDSEEEKRRKEKAKCRTKKKTGKRRRHRERSSDSDITSDSDEEDQQVSRDYPLRSKSARTKLDAPKPKGAQKHSDVDELGHRDHAGMVADDSESAREDEGVTQSIEDQLDIYALPVSDTGETEKEGGDFENDGPEEDQDEEAGEGDQKDGSDNGGLDTPPGLDVNIEELGFQVGLANSASTTGDSSFWHGNRTSTSRQHVNILSRSRTAHLPSAHGHAARGPRSYQSDSRSHDTNQGFSIANLRRVDRNLHSSSRRGHSDSDQAKTRKDRPAGGLDQGVRGKRVSKPRQQIDAHDSNVNSNPTSSDGLLTVLEKNLAQNNASEDGDEPERQPLRDVSAAGSLANPLSSRRRSLFRNVPSWAMRVPGVRYDDDPVPEDDAAKKEVRRSVPDYPVSPPPFHVVPPFHVSRQEKPPRSSPAVVHQAKAVTELPLRIPSSTPAIAPPGFIAQAHPDLRRKTREFLSYLPRMLVNDCELHYYLEQHHYSVDTALNAFVEDNDMLVLGSDPVHEDLKHHGNEEDLEAAKALPPLPSSRRDGRSDSEDRESAAAMALSLKDQHQSHDLIGVPSNHVDEVQTEPIDSSAALFTEGAGNDDLGSSTMQADYSSALAAGRLLYVENIPDSATERDLKHFFRHYHVNSIHRPVDPHTNSPASYALVDLVLEEEALVAIAELSGRMLHQVTISIQLASQPITSKIGTTSRPAIRSFDSMQSSNHNVDKGRMTLDSNEDTVSYDRSTRRTNKYGGPMADQKAANSTRKTMGQSLPPVRGKGIRSAPMSNPDRKAQATDTSISAASLAQKRKAEEMLGDGSVRNHFQAEGLSSKKGKKLLDKPDRTWENRYDPDDGDTHAGRPSITRRTPIPTSGEDRLQWMKLDQRTRSVPEAKTAFYTPFPADAARSNRRLGLYDDYLVGELSRGKDDAPTEPDPLIKDMVKPKPLTGTLYSVNGVPTAQATRDSCTDAFRPAGGSLAAKTPEGEALRLFLQRESRRSNAELIKSWPPKAPPPAVPRTQAWVAAQGKPGKSTVEGVPQSFFLFTPPSTAPSTPQFRHADLRQLEPEDSTPGLDVSTPAMHESTKKRGHPVRSVGQIKRNHTTILSADAFKENTEAAEASKPTVPPGRTTAYRSLQPSTGEHTKSMERRQGMHGDEEGTSKADTVSHKGKAKNAAAKPTSNGIKGIQDGGGSDRPLEPREKSCAHSSESSGNSSSESSSSDESSTDDSDNDSDDDSEGEGSGLPVARKLDAGSLTHQASHGGPQSNDSIQHEKLAMTSQDFPFSGFSSSLGISGEQHPSGRNLVLAVSEAPSQCHAGSAARSVLPGSPFASRRVAHQSASIRNSQPRVDRPSTSIPSPPRTGVRLNAYQSMSSDPSRDAAATTGSGPNSEDAHADITGSKKRKRTAGVSGRDEEDSKTAFNEPDSVSMTQRKRTNTGRTAKDEPQLRKSQDAGDRSRVWTAAMKQELSDELENLWGRKSRLEKKAKASRWGRDLREHYETVHDLLNGLVTEEKTWRDGGVAPRPYLDAAKALLSKLEAIPPDEDGDGDANPQADLVQPPLANLTDRCSEEYKREVRLDGYMLQLRDAALSVGRWDQKYEKKARKKLTKRLKKGEECRTFVQVWMDMTRWKGFNPPPAKNSPRYAKWAAQAGRERGRLTYHAEQAAKQALGSKEEIDAELEGN